MLHCLCCFCCLYENQQLKVETMSGRQLIDGPVFFGSLPYPSTLTESKMAILGINQQVLVTNLDEVDNTRYMFGPALVKLESAWESFGPIENCQVLDQDDYLVVRDAEGFKRIVKGPSVYEPTYGDIVEKKLQSIQVPINHYVIMEDSNSTTHPISHIRGPCKIYPEPFQTVLTNDNPSHRDKMGVTEKNQSGRIVITPMTTTTSHMPKGANHRHYFPCVEITTGRAIYLQLAAKNEHGETVVLIDTPQFYMPEIGEKVIAFTERIILMTTDFCILKSPSGDITVMDGENSACRSFFLRPYYEMLTFKVEKEVSILSTLPTFMPHEFAVRTSDNVTLKVFMRISYQIQKVEAFSNHPIDYYEQIKNHVQNKLMDKFSSIDLNDFMRTFSQVAAGIIQTVSGHFNTYGIEVLDVQILNFMASDSTQALLDASCEERVRKQNDQKALESDVLIQHETNNVNIQIKDLEVEMALKDNQVAIERKELENAIRQKEMDIEIAEEHKRKDLLEERRANDLMEAEFAGRAHGHEFNEFVKGVHDKFTPAQKMEILTRQIEFKEATSVYSKVNNISMYPPKTGREAYDFAEQLVGSKSEAK